MFENLPNISYNSILVVNALNGVLPIVLREAYPEARIVCGEVFPFFHEHLRSLGFEVVEWDKVDMKFDLVIGNPPYQNTHAAKRWPLWHEFVIRSKMLSSQHVALVTPNSWIGAGASDVKSAIWQSMIYCNMDVGKHFDVGSTFSYFLLDVNTETETFDVYTKKGIVTVPRTVPWLPNDISPESLSINQKFFCNPTFGFKRGECHTSNKDNFDTTGFDVFHTNAQTLYWKKPPPNYTAFKAAISLSGYSSFKLGKNFGVSQAAAYMLLEEDEIVPAESLFNSRLFSWILQVNKWSGWNSLEVIKSLPILPLTKLWSDQELYQHFKLTDDEIVLIENSVKAKSPTDKV